MTPSITGGDVDADWENAYFSGDEAPGGDNLTLVGIALGAYGLSQAILHVPFGMASDRWGRKPVIYIGLVIFAAGTGNPYFSTDTAAVLRAIQKVDRYLVQPGLLVVLIAGTAVNETGSTNVIKVDVA